MYVGLYVTIFRYQSSKLGGKWLENKVEKTKADGQAKVE